MAEIRIKAVIPKGDFEYKIFDNEITKTMAHKVRPEIREEFKKTVEGWEHKPIFRGTIKRVRNKSIRLLVQPTGPHKEQYRLVNRGARPHVIKPKLVRGPQFSLIFRRGYAAATSPRSLRSSPKRRFGDLVYKKVVRHPGFEARNFDVQIAEKKGDDVRRDLQKAMRTASLKSMPVSIGRKLMR